MKKSSRMSIVHSHAAGVDIGAEFHVVAVPPGADTEPVRTFQSFTGDLHRMSDWLKTCHITTVAMESTGVYWLPAFEILKAAGFNVILVNARDAKNVPGRKTDVNDAQWLQKLHSFGLLRASFRPEHDISVLRSYLRQRERLTEYRAAHIQHMQKALMQMNVQLHHAVSDKGCSPDNAACEGFFGRLKTEMYHGREWAGITPENFMQHVDAYIRWYNERRIKLSLGAVSPEMYRRKLGIAQ